MSSQARTMICLPKLIADFKELTTSNSMPLNIALPIKTRSKTGLILGLGRLLEEKWETWRRRGMLALMMQITEISNLLQLKMLTITVATLNTLLIQ